MTNVRLAKAFVRAFCNISLEEIPVKSWQEYNS